MKRLAGASALVASVVAGLLGASTVALAQADIATFNYHLQPRQIAQDTWVIEGAVDDFGRANGCNIINTAFIATGEGVVVINTGTSRLYGEQQRQTIEGVTREPVRHVFNLNLHPDYFFGNQAWADRPVQALPGTIAGQQAEGNAYADNLYRLCGDWMKATESTPANTPVEPQTRVVGGHKLELRRLRGHTADDLVVIDHTTGVLFAGGLIFSRRVPTTPHADFSAWLDSLDTLAHWQQSGVFKQVVPSHGPLHGGIVGIAETRDWLQWLTTTMRESAERGLDLSEVLRLPVPERFAAWAAQPAELQRSLAQWYPRYEQRAFSTSAR
ncbi:MBL fold metallo-hydrolase [Hydrogenophaga crassostreae]|uniref:MBL fold metallo-hydrolase n=1 Tax=Hydrogenophaga crassostreae TaxID=1763535 RepID=A0A167J1V9_9BURK|nr:quinoprotein relay system zinc metallohydrolase 1 [Hydrogenophaga crassostreae]AOW13747.1 MBL fold metallo-hydrolase [Hydrogenophaga crassostreae]OAD44290.1 MBL fold metallo-hydrolase [Hydrogenophaga crassostreae]